LYFCSSTFPHIRRHSWDIYRIVGRVFLFAADRSPFQRVTSCGIANVSILRTFLNFWQSRFCVSANNKCDRRRIQLTIRQCALWRNCKPYKTILWSPVVLKLQPGNEKHCRCCFISAFSFRNIMSEGKGYIPYSGIEIITINWTFRNILCIKFPGCDTPWQ